MVFLIENIIPTFFENQRKRMNIFYLFYFLYLFNLKFYLLKNHFIILTKKNQRRNGKSTFFLPSPIYNPPNILELAL